MKKLMGILMLVAFVATSCTGVKTSVGGKEDQGFLEFVGDTKKYKDKVEVVVGDRSPFFAKVKKDKRSRVKGDLYAIPPGKHVVSVRYQGQQVYSKQIFISAQETRKIELP
ncbi:MAG: hypothetical protein JJU02_16180 [Cryomorphaceae bacterium]|jgi:hypothetical protein|nr:hypothetical protein [Cryomorphaceae bacterium]